MLDDQKAKDKVYEAYRIGLQNLTTPFSILRNRSIIDYKDHMTARINGDISHLNLEVERPVVFNMARAATRSYLSKVAANPVKMKIKTYNILNDVYEPELGAGLQTMLDYSNDQSDHAKAFFDKSFDATVEGTAVEFEGFRDIRSKREVIDSFDPVTQEAITKEEERIIERGCFSMLRPLEDFLIANPFEEDLQKQAFIVDREIMDYESAEMAYGRAKNWSDVKAGNYWTGMHNYSKYRTDMLPELSENHVEVIHYYDLEGRYIRIINGAVNYNSVNPYKHGKYPYAKTIYDKFSGAPFFWGRSFVEQIEGDSDAYNILQNLLLEKQYLATNVMMLTENPEDFMEIGNVKNGKVYGVKNVNGSSIQKFPGVDNSDITMIGKLEQGLEYRAGNPTGGANATTPAGGRLLLQQTLQMQEEALKQIGYSMRLLERGERDRTELRVSNLIQFYSIPEKRDMQKGKTPLVYNTIRQENQKLSDGMVGMKIIKLIDNRKEGVVTKIQEMLDMEEASYDGNAEAVAFSVNDFNQIETFVSIVPNTSYATSQMNELQKLQQYIQIRLALIPESNRAALMAKVDELMEIDGSEFNPQAQGEQGDLAMQLQQAMQGAQGGQPTPEQAPPDIPQA